MGITFKSAPEYASIEAFVQHIIDDDRVEFSHEDLSALNYRTRLSVRVLRDTLESYGLILTIREPERHIRGFTTSSNDRFFGPGSDKMHGGAAYDSVQGGGLLKTTFGE